LASALISDWIKRALGNLDSRSISRLTVGVNLVLLTMLAYSFAQLTWLLVPGGGAGEAPSATLPVAPGSRPQQLNNKAMLVDNIIKTHLFGNVRSARPVPTASQMPQTKLNLVLKGVIASDDVNSARAIISDSVGNETFYAVGQQVPGGAELSEIHADSVTLIRQGRFETLLLPKAKIGEAEQAGVEKVSLPSALPSTPNATLRDFRQQILDQPQSVNDLLQVEPVTENGQFKGYRLQPGRDQAFLSRFGLEPGDVVTSINGIALDNPARGLDALRDLSSADEITIELLRNGQAQKKVFSLR